MISTGMWIAIILTSPFWMTILVVIIIGIVEIIIKFLSLFRRYK